MPLRMNTRGQTLIRSGRDCDTLLNVQTHFDVQFSVLLLFDFRQTGLQPRSCSEAAPQKVVVRLVLPS